MLFKSEYDLRKINTQFDAINPFPPGIMPKTHKTVIDEIFMYVLVLGYCHSVDV